MATALSRERKPDVNSSMLCSLCEGELKSPRLLPCQHSFCTQCLEGKVSNLQGGEQLKCPSCEKVVDLERNNVENLPDNFLFHIMKESMGFGLGDLECFSCKTVSKKTSSTHVCLDCGDPLCTSCKEWHCRTSASTHHLVVSFEEMKERKFHEEWVRRKQIKCKKHSLPLKFYCENCECLVCNDGFVLEHTQHKCKNVNETSTKHRPAMKRDVGEISETHHMYKQRVVKAKKVLATKQQVHEKQKNEIYKQAAEMHELVDKIKEEKIKELESHYVKEMEEINKIIQSESNQENEIGATETYGNDFLKHSSDADFLQHEKEVEKTLQKYKQMERKSYTVKSITTKCEEVETLTDGIRKVFGEIKVCDETILQDRKLGDVKGLFKYQVEDTTQVNGLAVDDDGNILVGCDPSPKILVLTKEGKHKRWIECDQLKSLWDIYVKGEDIYVTDFAQNERKVVVMDKEGKVKKVLRLPEEEQKFKSAVCIAVNDDDDRMIVSSCDTHTIYISDLNNGSFIPYITKQDQPDMDSPLYLHVTTREDLAYRKVGQNVVEAYDGNKELKWKYVSQDKRKLCATGICGDKTGNVYIADHWNPRIHVVNNGKPVGCIELGEDVKEVRPLSITENDELIYAYKNNIVKIAVWE